MESIFWREFLFGVCCCCLVFISGFFCQNCFFFLGSVSEIHFRELTLVFGFWVLVAALCFLSGVLPMVLLVCVAFCSRKCLITIIFLRFGFEFHFWASIFCWLLRSRVFRWCFLPMFCLFDGFLLQVCVVEGRCPAACVALALSLSLFVCPGQSPLLLHSASVSVSYFQFFGFFFSVFFSLYLSLYVSLSLSLSPFHTGIL